MKTWPVIILIVVVAVTFTAAPAVAAAKQEQGAGVPKYDPSTEVTLKGTVDEVRDRQCPVSGGLGSHIVLNLGSNKTIEVHLATTRFVKSYDLIFNKGDEVEVTGSKVTFEGVETIFAREVRRGNDTFVFRDKDGKPVW
jgi:DNA/RNA endonuclease YhcR with UshA esterase domain